MDVWLLRKVFEGGDGGGGWVHSRIESLQVLLDQIIRKEFTYVLGFHILIYLALRIFIFIRKTLYNYARHEEELWCQDHLKKSNILQYKYSLISRALFRDIFIYSEN